MFQMTDDQVMQMKAAMDKAAAEFWVYPDAAWQARFQQSWLQGRFGVDRAQSQDGLTWGADN